MSIKINLNNCIMHDLHQQANGTVMYVCYLSRVVTVKYNFIWLINCFSFLNSNNFIHIKDTSSSREYQHYLAHHY
jgi:hypothetical protein